MIDLPSDSSPIDFAYAIHSEIGNRASSAKVNGKIATLGTKLKNNDIVEIADALTDMLYIIHGTAISYGIPIDECFAEVHRSNMSKLEDCDCTKVNFIDYCMHCKNERKVPIYREDGKVLKGSHYSPPQLSAILFPLVES